MRPRSSSRGAIQVPQLQLQFTIFAVFTVLLTLSRRWHLYKLQFFLHLLLLSSLNTTYMCVVCLCRILYWTDWSPTAPAIYRLSVVNPARQTLVSGNLVLPVALTIDFTGNQSRHTGILPVSSWTVQFSCTRWCSTLLLNTLKYADYSCHIDRIFWLYCVCWWHLVALRICCSFAENVKNLSDKWRFVGYQI